MDKLFEKHGKYEDFGEKNGDNPLNIAETQFHNAKTRFRKAKTRFQNAENAYSHISFASTCLDRNRTKNLPAISKLILVSAFLQ